MSIFFENISEWFYSYELSVIVPEVSDFVQEL